MARQRVFSPIKLILTCLTFLVCSCLGGCLTLDIASSDVLLLAPGQKARPPFYSLEDFEKLARRIPEEPVAPVMEFVDGVWYVNVTVVSVAWINPTDRPWCLPPGGEQLWMKNMPLSLFGKEPPYLKIPGPAILLGTRVSTADRAWSRREAPESIANIAKDIPSGFPMDKGFVMWPGVMKILESDASVIEPNAGIVLPPHSKGYITSLFLAHGYSNATFTLHLADGLKGSDLSVRLHSKYSGTSGARVIPMLSRMPVE